MRLERVKVVAVSEKTKEECMFLGSVSFCGVVVVWKCCGVDVVEG